MQRLKFIPLLLSLSAENEKLRQKVKILEVDGSSGAQQLEQQLGGLQQTLEESCEEQIALIRGKHVRVLETERLKNKKTLAQAEQKYKVYLQEAERKSEKEINALQATFQERINVLQQEMLDVSQQQQSDLQATEERWKGHVELVEGISSEQRQFAELNTAEQQRLERVQHEIALEQLKAEAARETKNAVCDITSAHNDLLQKHLDLKKERDWLDSQVQEFNKIICAQRDALREISYSSSSRSEAKLLQSDGPNRRPNLRSRVNATGKDDSDLRQPRATSRVNVVYRNRDTEFDMVNSRFTHQFNLSHANHRAVEKCK
jgi:hypothetical protein